MLSKAEQEKVELALELKFLLAQDKPTAEIKDRVKTIINSYEPFLSCPLLEAPPAELFDCLQPTVLELDVRQEAVNYLFVVLAGQVFVRNRLAQHEQLAFRSFIDMETLDRLRANFLTAELVADSNSFVLKINEMWREDAKKEQRRAKVNYCRNKLKHVDFFLGLSYGDFQRLCENCKVMQVTASSTIVTSGSVPKYMYCLAEGLIQVERDVEFRLDTDLQEVFLEEAVKNKPCLEQFIQEMIQDPTEEESRNGMTVTRHFILKELEPGLFFCGKEVLKELTMIETLRAEVKCKVLAFSYSDLFNIDKEKMRQIKTLQMPYETSAREIRRQYYAQQPWLAYRQFLLNENRFEAQTKNFDYNKQLRGSLDLNTRKYQFIPDPSMFMNTQTISKQELTSNPVRRMEFIQQAVSCKGDQKQS